MKRALTFFGVLAVLILTAIWVLNTRENPRESLNNQEILEAPLEDKNNEIIPEEKSKLHLLFAGDVMLDRGVEWYIKEIGENDFSFPFKKAKKYLDSFDGVFVNLEGPVSDKGVLSGSIYSFRMEPEAILALKFANIRAVSVANNHAWDYGRLAFEDSLVRLRDANIGYFGGGDNSEEAYSAYYFQKNDITVALLGFTEFLKSAEAKASSSGIAFLSNENMKNAIETAKMNADFVFVIMHAGEEYKYEPAERQREYAHSAIDFGADMVIGHHPHVIEATEEYNGKKIFYSLGNFIFDQSFSDETMTTGLLEIVLDKNEIVSAELKTGELTKYYELIPPSIGAGVEIE